MWIWTAFAIMAAVTVAVLLAPLWRRPEAAVPQRADYNLAVFRDQMAELERDRDRGLIGATEADAARNEISRRMLQLAGGTGPTPSPGNSRRLVHVFSALLVPALAVSLYLREGSPQLPDEPRVARLQKAAESGDLAALIAKVEDHLSTNPDDAEGWGVLAPIYKREGRWEDAANAYAQVLRLKPLTAQSLADYAEMLVFAKQGLVTADAREAFTEAARLDSRMPRVRFYLALALKQEGKRDEAGAAMESLLADSPADAPWRPMLEKEMAELASQPPAMAGEDQQAMIRAMVDGLEDRLRADGDDLEGWLRLIRSRTVLNEADRARAALATARTQFKDNPQALSAIDGLARELNLI
jgi:cytochrome c-type biogenesis protein CcmH